jgi:hypothetical protein
MTLYLGDDGNGVPLGVGAVERAGDLEEALPWRR